MTRTVHVPTSDDLAAARDVVAQHLRPTPLHAIGGRAWLKLETMQPVGAFKVRGALAALSRLRDTGRIVTASAGNHALGVAWASRHLRVPVTIVVATTAAPVKIDKLRALGADLILHGDSYDEAEAHGIDLAAEGGHFLSAYNDTAVIAGQATVLDEILAALPDDGVPVTLHVPVGGGGLLAGIALRAREITTREIHLVGIEAEQSMAVSSGVRTGHTVDIPIGDTLADGLAGNVEPGSITVDIIREANVTLRAVPEATIRDAIRWFVHEQGMTCEGSAAVAIADLRTHQQEDDGHHVALVTGRNITWLVLRGILDEAR
jgi:threonine dehydratase